LPPKFENLFALGDISPSITETILPHDQPLDPALPRLSIYRESGLIVKPLNCALCAVQVQGFNDRVRSPD
jgi:hypothetical protein